MDNYYMGAELAAEELGMGSSVPRRLPPEGVIIPRREADGWTRKYLHQMGKNPICIAEIPPRPSLEGPSAMETPVPLVPEYHAPASEPAPMMEQQVRVQPLMAGKGVPVSTPVRVAVPGGGGMPSAPMMGGSVPLRMPTTPIPVNPGLGRPVAEITTSPAMVPPSPYLARMGQSNPLPTVQPDQAPAPAPAPAPEQPSDPTCGVCPPGPMQMPDGTVVGLDDPITLRVLCQMMPSILKSIGSTCAPGTAPAAAPAGPQAPYSGGPIPVQNPGMGGYPSFGPGGGMFGGGGFGGGGSGGGGGGGINGPLGVVNQATPQGGPGQNGAPGPVGPAGPAGAPGPAGPGSIIDFFVLKTGSFFTVGAPVPIPGFELGFTVLVAGPVEFKIMANFTRPIVGSTFPQVTFGIQLEPDGGPATDQPLTFVQEQQGAGDDKVFDFPMTGIYAQTLNPGHYTVRGLYSGGFGVGLIFAASDDRPAVITVSHS